MRSTIALSKTRKFSSQYRQELVNAHYNPGSSNFKGYFLYLGVDSTATISDSTFTRAFADRGMAIYSDSFSRLKLNNSLIQHSLGADASVYGTEQYRF